jgi:hypothetical protein
MTDAADDIRSLWQSMPSETVYITADAMHTRAAKFQARIRTRNFIEYTAFVFVVVVMGKFALDSTTWQGKTAAGVMIACCSLVVWNLHRRARAIAAPAGASTAALLDFQRAELIRQRDAMASVWRWYFLPFVPAFALFAVFGWMGVIGNGVPLERVRLGVTITVVLFAATFAIGVLLNLLGAAHLQRQIETLDRYKETH